MANPIKRVLSRIDAQRTGSGQWEGRCPAHDDERESLSISEGDDGRVLLYCHAGCAVDDVVAAAGLEMRDLFPAAGGVGAVAAKSPPRISSRTPKPAKPPNPPAKPLVPVKLDTAVRATAGRLAGAEASRWLYHDEGGREVAAVVRFEQPTGKTYRPFHKDGPVWKEGGMGGERPLYRLDELSAGGVKRVYVCEGEKAADAARELGLIATTSMGGAEQAGKANWRPLAGREVVILPDNDAAGKRYAAKVSEVLAKLSPQPSVKAVVLPSLPEHGDIVEFIDARREAGLEDEEIRAEVDEMADDAGAVLASGTEAAASPRRTGPVLVSLADVEPEEVEWLWPGRIPLGKVTMIAGDPGLGKSLATLDMAARVSAGSPWPDSLSAPTQPGGVLVMSTEDDNADTVVPRLMAAGADLTRIKACNSVHAQKPSTAGECMFNLEDHLPQLEQAIQQVPDLRLIIIDPISAFMGKTDSHNNTEVRGLLAPLAALAAKYHVAVVGVTHLNKNAGGSPIYRTIGSIAQVAAARAAYGVAKCKHDRSRRLFLPMKNNLAPDEHGLAYRIVDSDIPGVARVQWEPAPVDISAEEAFGPEMKRPGPEPTDREDAERWLREALADGPRPMKEIWDAAINGEGINERTLRRAKEKMGVESYQPKTPGPWFWRLQQHEEKTQRQPA